MSSPLPSPVLLDDSQLVRAAQTPRTRLFQVLGRVTALTPLIVVCAVMPALQLLTNATLDDLASLWGLRSLGVAYAHSIDAIVTPGLNEPGQSLIYQAPLAAWLNGIVTAIVGPLYRLSESAVSLIAIALAIWLITRMAWRIGGANIALISALLMCSHPLVLEMAVSPGNGSIGLCLMLVAVFGFQRHLEGKSTQVSRSLAASGMAWGLALLAIGPVAFSIPVLFAGHALNQQGDTVPESDLHSFGNYLRPNRSVMRSTLFVVGTGLVVASWWNLMMFAGYGTEFAVSWWTSLPIEFRSEANREWRSDLLSLLQPSWSDWFIQQSLIIAWLVVGLEQSWNIWRNPPTELARRRSQLLLFWWVIGVVGRIRAEFIGHESVSNTFVWNVALLTPTVLLAALGVGTLIERHVSRRGEFFLIVLLVSLIAARFTMSWFFGLIAAAIAATFLVLGPLVIPQTAREEHGWSEQNWRRILQFLVYGSLIGSVGLGLGQRGWASSDPNRLSDLQQRLKELPPVRRISLIAARNAVPISLQYALKRRWPAAELVTTDGWEQQLTTDLSDQSKSQNSRFQILEWTYRDPELSADHGYLWQIMDVTDPMRFHGRGNIAVMWNPPQ